MLYMRKATNISIRELEQNLKRVIARVERGQIVEVTRHRRPVARLAPVRPIGDVLPWPDLDARARAVSATAWSRPVHRNRSSKTAVSGDDLHRFERTCRRLRARERFSNAARQTVRAVPQVPFTLLHGLEVPNALSAWSAAVRSAEKNVGLSTRSCRKTSTASGSRECPWIWTLSSRVQATSHEPTPPGFSLEAWICCTSQPPA
jgi:prevent-host-death family protein